MTTRIGHRDASDEGSRSSDSPIVVPAPLGTVELKTIRPVHPAGPVENAKNKNAFPTRSLENTERFPQAAQGPLS